MSFISFLLILLLTVCCKEKKKIRQRSLINPTNISDRISRKSTQFHKDLLANTDLTSEHIEIIKTIDKDLAEKRKREYAKSGNRPSDAKRESLEMEKKLKIREALNDDLLYLEYASFDKKYKQFRRTKREKQNRNATK